MKRKMETGSITMAVGGALTAVIAIIAMLVMFAKCERVAPGEVGVSVRKCDQGGVTNTPIPTGYYWRDLFCEDVVRYPTNLQTLILTKSPQEGDGPEEDDSITVTSREGMPINVDISLSFTLDSAKVPNLYQRFRQEIGHLKQAFVRQTVREAMQMVFSQYTAEELYSTKREAARAESQKFLTERLATYGFVVVQFTVNETRVPKQIVEAINNKVAMVQEAQRAEQEVKKKQAEAQQKVAEAKGEAEANRERAAGEAEAIRLRAEAQSKANELLSRSVTPALIQYEQMRRWDGKLPQYSGSVTPFLQVK